MGVRVAVDLPQTFGGGPVDPGQVRDRAREAEALGFDGVWVSEDLLGAAGTLDALTTLSFVASVTERVDLGVAVVLAALHDPVHLAKATASLDQLSGGRLIVGLGLGGDRSVYPAFGLSARGRARRFDRVVEALDALWRGSAPPSDDPMFQLDGRRVLPGPRQSPRPRLWFGGHSPAALARAAHRGDGYVGGGTSTATSFGGAAASVRELLAGPVPAARPASFTIAKRVYVGCDTHVPGAGPRLRGWLRSHYQGRVSDSVAITGDVPTCVAGLQGLITAGADYLILSYVEEQQRNFAGAARDFLPALRRP